MPAQPRSEFRVHAAGRAGGLPAAVAHLGPAVLGVGVAHRDVRVDGRLLEVLVIAEAQRRPVDDIHRPGRRLGAGVRQQEILRIEEIIARATDRVAQARRPEHRQVQVEQRTDPVAPQGLAEVLVALRQLPPVARGVAEPGDADRRVDREAFEFDPRALEVGLERAVHEADRGFEVGEEVADPAARRLRHDLGVARRGWFQHPEIQLVVEVEEHPVDGFQRVRHLDHPVNRHHIGCIADARQVGGRGLPGHRRGLGRGHLGRHRRRRRAAASGTCQRQQRQKPAGTVHRASSFARRRPFAPWSAGPAASFARIRATSAS